MHAYMLPLRTGTDPHHSFTSTYSHVFNLYAPHLTIPLSASGLYLVPYVNLPISLTGAG